MDAETQNDGGTPTETSPADDKPWRFKKGNPGGPGRGNRKQAAVGQPPALLLAMRRVANTESTADRTALQRECRKWLEENRSAFMTKLLDFEKALAPKPEAEAAPTQAADVDVGTEKCVQLCEEWLRAHGAK
jgi:hypothetical protein